MKFFLNACLFVYSACGLTSCLSVKEPVCQSTGFANITSVSGPRTASVNQPVVFLLRYSLGTDCGTYTSVQSLPNGNTLQVAVGASYNGCACTATTTTAQVPYQFQATVAGTYYLNFLTTNNAFITDTVVVQ